MKILYLAPVSRCWIRQRPHFVAEKLAKSGTIVFWLFVAPWGKVHFSQWRMDPGFQGLELPVCPFSFIFRPAIWINALLIRLVLFRSDADCVIVTNPRIWAWLPKRLRNKPLLYDCMDIQPYFFSGMRRKKMAQAERCVVNRADCLVASSSVIADYLVEKYGVLRDSIHIIPNAIAMKRDLNRGDLKDLSLGIPSLVYLGTVDTWFDWSSVIEAAVAHPEWNIWIVGPRGCTAPESLPRNIHLQDAVPHEEIGNWLFSASVLLLPFVRNKLIDGVDPVKMYEYLSAGRPVVSSWWPLLKKFERFPAVRFYKGAITLKEAVEQALAGEKIFTVPESFLRENTWESRVDDFNRVLQSLF